MKKIEDITNLYQEVFYMPDITPLRMVIATVISVYMEGSPVWLMVSGASGTGKTEVLNIVDGVEKCFHISVMTENTLLSGSRAPNKAGMKDASKNDVSLLKRIGNYGIMVMKEFNTLLDMRQDQRGAILSQLRSVYDGHLIKQTGLGESIEWKGKISFLGACTEKFFQAMETLDAAGPRFTVYVLPVLSDLERKERLTKVKEKGHLFPTTRIKLRDMVADFVKEKIHTIGSSSSIEIPEDFDETINLIADFTGVALTHVGKDWKGRVDDIFDSPDGTRFYLAARKLTQAMMSLTDGEPVLLERDRLAIIKMMFDTIPRKRHKILKVLCQFNEMNTKAMAHYLHLPTDIVRVTLQELDAMRVVARRSSGSMSVGDHWVVEPRYRELFTKYAGVDFKGGSIIHQDEDGGDDIDITRKLSAFRRDESVDDPAFQEETMVAAQTEADRQFELWSKKD